MRKIIFIDIPMKRLTANNKVCYAHTGNTNYNYSEKVFYPITTVLADKIKQNDDLKVVLIKTTAEYSESDENENKLKEELNTICNDRGIHIQYECVEAPFIETHKNNEARFRTLLKHIEEDAEIYADITFGQKSLPLLLMCVLNFAEKFFNANVHNIIYGKVEFTKDDKREAVLKNPELYDVTSLYYLNNLIGTMYAPSGSAAIKILDEFFLI